ncbi:MAG: hypothetical protein ACK4RK_09365 [Gemmataceae bacterium]
MLTASPATLSCPQPVNPGPAPPAIFLCPVCAGFMIALGSGWARCERCRYSGCAGCEGGAVEASMESGD